jgi:flagellar export protein FliJ
MPTTTDRWEAIARLRATIRDERRLELAACESEQSVLRDQLTCVESALARWQGEARAALAGRVDLGSLRHARSGIAALSCQHQEVLARCAAAAARVERGREALVEADREVKALERLIERREAEELQAEFRRETARLDEHSLISLRSA